MREIKFRAWQKNYKEMYQPFCGYLELGEAGIETIGFEDGDLCLRNSDVIVMQYTGQKDYKKIEIYEGDIIQFTEVDEDSCMGAEETHIVSVEWINDISQWMCIFQSGRRIDLRCITNFRCIKECDVIGNIYENPELLTKEK